MILRSDLFLADEDLVAEEAQFVLHLNDQLPIGIGLLDHHRVQAFQLMVLFLQRVDPHVRFLHLFVQEFNLPLGIPIDPQLLGEHLHRRLEPLVLHIELADLDRGRRHALQDRPFLVATQQSVLGMFLTTLLLAKRAIAYVHLVAAPELPVFDSDHG